MDPDPLHCSFCGKPKAEVRKLVAGGGRQVAPDRVLAPVAICDACVAFCAEACAEGEPEVIAKMHRVLESLVRLAIDAVNAPPPQYGETPEGLKWWATRLLSPVREALLELEADEPFQRDDREADEEALAAATRRVWDLIDELRRARARRHPVPGP